MNIGSRQIGPAHPPYFIAEIGVNHDGDADRAVELAHAAADAGADAVKLQLFRTDLLMSRAAKLAAYQSAAGETDPIEMLRRLELSIEQMQPVVAAAKQRGVHAIVTVFSEELVEHAESLSFDAYKVASPDIIHKPLLLRLMQTNRPLIISTGASTINEVTCALDWLKPAHDRLAVLQCVSSYPTAINDASVGGIRAIQTIWNGPVGYSDHTAGIGDAGWVSIAAGGSILEKHLTWNKRASGPDHAASLEPHDFAAYVAMARWVQSREFERFVHDRQWHIERESAFGSSEKRVLPSEQDVRCVSRQSIVARHAMPAGHVVKQFDLTIKRPGTGLAPARLDEIIGRRTARDVQADMPMTEHDLA